MKSVISLTKKLPLLLIAAALVGGLCGCEDVKPWQRGSLADYTMRANRDPIGQAQLDHIYFSREMASGGEGIAGGGCGCN